MNRKSKALKGLLTLVIVIALCMFFARTVQTITTPKVQRISATKGKLEQKIPLTGEIYFPDTEAVKVENAKKLNITVETVNVRVGYYVEAGDVVFTAFAPDFESKLKELQNKRDEKVKEYAGEYAGHIKISQTTRQNDMYNEMADAIDAYYTARYALSMQALQEDYKLPADDTAMGQINDGSENLNALSAAFAQATAARDAAVQQYSDLINGKLPGVYRIADSTFEYVKKIEGLRKDIDDYDRQMLEMRQLYDSLTEVRAPHAGYITSFELKSGDTYDGSKPAFEMTKEGGLPVLRADVTQVDKTLREGLKVVLTGSDAASEVERLENSGDGKKYVYVKLDNKTIKAAGGLSRMIADGEIPMTLTYKANKSATLLPASAVRSDGGSGYYVYVVERTYGGLLDSSGYKISKSAVTVLEKSDQVVAVSEDLSYREIADREDRALSEGQAVMDYVD